MFVYRDTDKMINYQLSIFKNIVIASDRRKRGNLVRDCFTAFAMTMFIAIFLVTPAPVAAQSFSLSIYPPLLQVLIKPGKTITQVYKIANDSEKDIEVVPRVVPFKPIDDQGNINLILNKSVYDKSVNWFSLQNSDKQLSLPFTIPAGKTEEMVLKIQVPADATQKDYYYSLIVKNNPVLLSQGLTRARASGILGSNILLSVSSTELTPKDIVIDWFSLQKSFILKNLVDSFDDVSFKAVALNQSMHLFSMDGEIIVKDNTGKEIKKMAFLPTNVLANSNRQAICSDAPNCELSKRLLFGRYQAIMTLKVANETIQSGFYFYVMPIRATLILLAMFGFGVLFVKFVKKVS